MSGFAHTFDLATFRRRWRMIAAGASKDSYTPVLCGLLIEHHPGGVRLVATDSYLLATSWVPELNAAEADEPDLLTKPTAWALIAARSHLVAAILRGRGELILKAFVTQVVFSTGQGKANIPTLAGDYPDWRQLFRDASEPSLTYGLGNLAFVRFATYTKGFGAGPIRLGVTSELAATRFDYEPDLIRGLVMPVRRLGAEG